VVNKTLQDVSPSPALVHYICILEALARTEIWPAAKFTLRASLAFSYIDRITARHSTSGSQPIFVAMYKEWNTGLSQTAPPIFGWAAITLDIGPHSSFVHFAAVQTAVQVS